MNLEKSKLFFWHALPIVGLLLWGLLCITNHLWYDEAYSAAMVQLPWKKMIYITAVDAHSPFYYALLKICYLIFGSKTHFVVLKLFSLAFMTGYLLLGKYYVKKLFSLEISVYFMLFSLLIPIMSVQAGNVRMYAMALFFSTLMGLSAYDIYKEATGKKWIVFCFASVCTVYCHTFAMIMAVWFYVLFFWVLMWTKQYQKIRGFFMSGGAVSILFLPWLYVTAKQMSLRMRYDTGSVQDRAGLASFLDYGKEWFSALETPILLVCILGVCLFVFLLLMGIIWCVKKKNGAPAVSFGALFLTVLTGFLVSVFVNNCFLGRYVFPGFGFLMLFYAVGMEQIRKNGLKLAVVAVAVFCFVMQYSSELSLEYDKGYATYERFLQENVTKEDVVIAPFAHTVFLSIYHPELTFYIDEYKSYKLPFAQVKELSNHGMLKEVTGKLWYLCFAGEEPVSFREEYDYELAAAFHYMYYDFVIYRLYRK